MQIMEMIVGNNLALKSMDCFITAGVDSNAILCKVNVLPVRR